MEYNSDYDVRLATLSAIGGDTSKQYDSVYDIDLEILRITEEGGGAGGKVIDDETIDDTNTWSSEKITETYEPATNNEIEELFN